MLVYTTPMNPWIKWANQLKAISQIGQTYTKDDYDAERYEQLSHIANEMMALLADAPLARVENFFVPDQGYATPKVDLRAGVFQDNKVLLVRKNSMAVGPYLAVGPTSVKALNKVLHAKSLRNQALRSRLSA